MTCILLTKSKPKALIYLRQQLIILEYKALGQND